MAGIDAEIPDLHVMKEGDNVILDVNGERQSCVKIIRGGQVKVGKQYVSVDPLIGERFGSLFEVAGTQVLEKRKRVCETAGEDWEGVLEIDKNNSQLLDAGRANQGLTTADIARLKAEGKSGDEIVAALAANSATFQNKTHYSQEKYKRKKAKKYTTHVTCIRPVARSLADFYFNKIPVKTGWLRSDSLAVLLTQANVGAATRMLVVDGTGGLVAGSVMERMAGTGTLVSGYVGDRRPSTETVSMFNFPPSIRKQLIPASIASLRAYLPADRGEAATAQPPATTAVASANGNSTAAAETLATAQAKVATAGLEEAAEGGTTPPASEGNAELVEQPSKKQKTEAAAHGAVEVDAVNRKAAPSDAPQSAIANGRAARSAGNTNRGMELSAEDEARQAQFAREREEKEAGLKAACLAGFQSCVVCAPLADPGAVFEAVFPLLAPSASFAVFFHALQPLAECMNSLVRRKGALGMQLQESWFRQYQVLPGRTHPTMATSGSGGYILSGTKVKQS